MFVEGGGTYTYASEIAVKYCPGYMSWVLLDLGISLFLNLLVVMSTIT